MDWTWEHNFGQTDTEIVEYTDEHTEVLKSWSTKRKQKPETLAAV